MYKLHFDNFLINEHDDEASICMKSVQTPCRLGVTRILTDATRYFLLCDCHAVVSREKKLYVMHTINYFYSLLQVKVMRAKTTRKMPDINFH